MELLKDYTATFSQKFMEYLPSLIGALVILIVGLWIIKLIIKMLRKLLIKREVDLSLQKFLLNLLGWVLKFVLFVIVISQMGIQTTSFIAVLGAAGLAVGLALQGSLSNFAGGVLIILFKPFKIGDFIEAQGESGTVKDISIFYTKVLTINNQLVIIPNGKLSNENIKNYTSEGKRRDVISFGISYDSDIKKAREVLVELMKEQETILKDPEPVVFVAELADSSVNLSARFWAMNEDFWDCHFYTIEEAKSRLEDAGIVIPFPQRDVHLFQENK
ncbi:MAG: mechanosensitive ion channel domain-containing protein [Flavobacteriaceae bacterium]